MGSVAILVFLDILGVQGIQAFLDSEAILDSVAIQAFRDILAFPDTVVSPGIQA